jgi:hypothetical protein
LSRVAWRYFSLRIGCCARDSAQRKGIEMRTHFTTPSRLPMWIAGISISLTAALGIAATLRWMPASYANIAGESAPFEHGAASNGSEDTLAKGPQAGRGQARATSRNRSWCDECGVVESMRQIKRSGDVGGQDTVIAAAGGDIASREHDRAIAAKGSAEMRYEFTVRFRDGSSKIFNDTSPRAWPLGSRVIVIGHSNASNN